MTGTYWRPSAGPHALRERARLLAEVRRFFARRGVLEVDTPVLAAAPPTDPHIESLSLDADIGGRRRRLYLQPSPEFAMKRLLAVGCGPIYQIGKAFRGGETGRLHAVEFTMLEWYRPRFGLRRLMDEVTALLLAVAGERPVHRFDHAALVGDVTGVDVHSAADAQVRELARSTTGLEAATLASLGRADCLDLVFSHAVQPTLSGLSLVHGYPACQAALARIEPGRPPRAARFEAFLDGVEVANGYHELADADEQARRMAADVAERRRLGLAEVPVDDRLIAALRAGIGDVSGVAVGLDRVFAVALGFDSVAEVIAFGAERA